MKNGEKHKWVTEVQTVVRRCNLYTQHKKLEYEYKGVIQ